MGCDGEALVVSAIVWDKRNPTESREPTVQNREMLRRKGYDDTKAIVANLRSESGHVDYLLAWPVRDAQTAACVMMMMVSTMKRR